MQLEGMFDLAVAKVSERKWSVNLDLPAEWNVGVIVGSSGSGKTTVANEVFGPHMVRGFKWAKDKSIVDCFPSAAGIKDITALLCSVGFSSPPSWLRPFHVLSNGEQFRVTVARALAEQKEIAVMDEFTSVVDRNVAQIGSAAIAKTIRHRKQKFIAVSCHYDILEWLEPDWVYEPATDTLTVGRLLRRPKIELEIFRVHHSAWQLFRQHHYLNTSLNKSSVSFVAMWRGVPVAFMAWLSLFSGTVLNGRIGHRLVVLPDFQGIGIGNRVRSYLASMWTGLGKRAYITAAHPATVNGCAHSLDWRMCRATGLTSPDSGKKMQHSTHRLTTGFEYIGASMLAKQAQDLFSA
jgi:ABC-type thiamine transport system ATPase subunit/GNAT superfamily N-acetyltransferase